MENKFSADCYFPQFGGAFFAHRKNKLCFFSGSVENNFLKKRRPLFRIRETCSKIISGGMFKLYSFFSLTSSN